ncbi:hypothetical protein FQZ97_545980 [compost metagenome]
MRPWPARRGAARLAESGSTAQSIVLPALIVAIPSTGALSDRYGRKPVMPAVHRVIRPESPPA